MYNYTPLKVEKPRPLYWRRPVHKDFSLTIYFTPQTAAHAAPSDPVLRLFPPPSNLQIPNRHARRPRMTPITLIQHIQQRLLLPALRELVPRHRARHGRVRERRRAAAIALADAAEDAHTLPDLVVHGA